MFSIIKTNAIINPDAMVIHIEYTFVAGTTVMCTFWLESTVHHAVFALDYFSILLAVVAPHGGNLARLAKNTH